ncbi:MAG: hypothetical protein PHQ98_01115 [Candidatus ainarchaeum sp.]|nr:hypothetical protein [Candidatus ainarchaeum sp.]
MKMKNIIRLFFCFGIVIFIMLNVSALLVSTTVEKTNLKLNEIDKLEIKVYNDEIYTLENVYLYVTGEENITFIDSYQNITGKTIEKLNAGEMKTYTFLFKLNSIEKNDGKIFVYYGKNNKKEQVSGTYVNLIESDNILINTNTELRDISGLTKIVTDVQIINDSNYSIYQVRGEIRPTNNYIINNNQMFFEEIKSGEEKSFEFIITPPIGIEGEQEVIMNYGYFDSDKLSHYFEEKEIMIFGINQKLNLILIGVTLIIIAIGIYLWKYTGKSG